jgi:DNA-binding LytR/AlgR family response regulator
MKVLIIEDEYHAANRLVKLIQSLRPNYTVVTILDSVESSIAWLTSNEPPSLIFQDIQLGDGLSFDIYERIKILCPIIFTTAFDEYAIRAFKTNSIDYLLKPITEESLIFSIEKFESLNSHQASIDPAVFQSIIRQIQSSPRQERLVSKNGNHTIIIKISDILLFQSEDSITFAYQKNGQKSIVNHTLDQLETIIEPSQFFRVSRNTIIGIEVIKKISPHLNNRLSVEHTIAKLDHIIVSRERVKDFRLWIGEKN